MKTSNKSSQQFKLNIIFRAEPEGGFTALVPSLPGCITYGKNLNEATRMAEEAISLYLEDMLADGENIPKDPQSYLSTIEVNVPASLSVHA